MSKTTAVVVAFHPEPQTFSALIKRLNDCVDAIVVVDNSTNTAVRALCTSLPDARIDYLNPPRNIGVSSALNLGIEHAWANGADYVLLSDHDSLPAVDMVERLHEAIRALTPTDIRIAAVGPGFTDRRRPRASPFVRIEGGRYRRIPFTPADPPIRLDFLITSGSLISRAAWEAVGPMDDRLFIDYVDIEWGLRARNRGWVCFGVPAAQMSHAIGETPRMLFGYELAVHSPIRRYYQVRNAVWLYRQQWMPRDWKQAEGPKSFLKLFVLALLVAPRWATLRLSLIGLWHGLRSRMGPFSIADAAKPGTQTDSA